MKTNASLFNERNIQIPQGPYNVHPIFVEKAKGAVITDIEGMEYIDFAGGIGAANVGHCNEEVLQAIRDQIEKYIQERFRVTTSVQYEFWCDIDVHRSLRAIDDVSDLFTLSRL